MPLFLICPSDQVQEASYTLPFAVALQVVALNLLSYSPIIFWPVIVTAADGEWPFGSCVCVQYSI